MYSLCVIVPFYNEEKFLKKSIESLLDNDVYDQIILIDDCSNDNSPQIAQDFKNRIKKI